MPDLNLRIVVVEDQVLFQQLLANIASKQFGYEILGIASDGLEAMRICRETRPDLVLLDLLIPKMTGLVVAENLKAEFPAIKLIAISSEEDPLTVHRVFEIGFNGFIDKSTQTLNSLIAGIERVASGKSYFSEKIQRIREDLLAQPHSFQKILSPREQEILALIGGCYSDQEIGLMIGLSASTVQTHRKNIMGKVGTHSTPALIRYALDMGFWKPHEDRLDKA